MSAHTVLPSPHVFEAIRTKRGGDSAFLRFLLETILKTRSVVSEYDLAMHAGMPPQKLQTHLEILVAEGMVIRLDPIGLCRNCATDTSRLVYYRWRCPDDSRYRWQQDLFRTRPFHLHGLCEPSD
jgi:hypothetical protein